MMSNATIVRNKIGLCRQNNKSKSFSVIKWRFQDHTSFCFNVDSIVVINFGLPNIFFTNGSNKVCFDLLSFQFSYVPFENTARFLSTLNFLSVKNLIQLLSVIVQCSNTDGCGLTVKSNITYFLFHLSVSRTLLEELIQVLSCTWVSC